MKPSLGYVWFLPGNKPAQQNVSKCTEQQLTEMLNGSFFLQQMSFGANEDIMQENMKISDWHKLHNNIDSKYVGYAYDAVWTYAYALQKIRPNVDNHSRITLHSSETMDNIVNYMKDTDFMGLSGRLTFNRAGSRFTNITVNQWVNGKTVVIGKFEPIIENWHNSSRHIADGKLTITKEIQWITNSIPTDGSHTCEVIGLAQLFNVKCTIAINILIIFICIILIVIFSMASFVFWQWRYKKLIAERELLSLSNTLIALEVPSYRIVINREIGNGAYGKVYGGEAMLKENVWSAVAVKQLKNGSTDSDRLNLLSEAEALRKFDHSNILKLLGVCIQSEPISTIVEFMLNGDLKSYLLKRRDLVGRIIPEQLSGISPQILTSMVLDIAKALTYLAEKNYVHRDIAARNCLVSAELTVKVGDFGLARAMCDDDCYHFTRIAFLPIRWMAPESMCHSVFRPASDMWSFGIVLYEIITFGSFPYRHLNNSEVLEYIQKGGTLRIPNGVEPKLKELMQSCWEFNYENRPTAIDAVHLFENHPYLITPCLDDPLAAVHIFEGNAATEQLDLLSFLRRNNNNNMNNNQHNSSSIVLTDNSVAMNISPDGYVVYNGANDLSSGQPLLEIITNEDDR